ncbi:MAG TPA: SH3 domain-containing protein [Candidatus Cloacimonadota bacterium]|nr:SH3 domain-containing protein [Candidatus Cloacimonadota bacterium]
MNALPSQDHWIEKSELDGILLTDPEIIEFNRELIKQNESLNDLYHLPDEIAANDIHRLLSAYDIVKIQNYHSLDHHHFDAEFCTWIDKQLNLPLGDSSKEIRYGFILERANLRSFPTEQIAMNDDVDQEIDRFQETALYPLEPIAIYHESLDGKWKFVQSYNYSGWVRNDQLFEMDRNTFIECFEPDDFYYVTSDHAIITLTIPNYSTRKILMPMGSRIPKYLVNNQTQVCRVEFEMNQIEIQEKRVEYTRANILKLALQRFGDSYDWGGKRGHRDCSSLVMDIFRCFGINLPRNANQQSDLKGIVKYDCLHASVAEKLENMKPGNLIFLPGHVMIYAGTFRDVPYIIHAVKEYYILNNGSIERSSQTGVQITPLGIFRKNWESYLTSLHTICEILPMVKINK